MAVLAFAAPVSAGTDGQQLELVVHCYANWSEIRGYNQNGNWRDQFYNTPAADPFNNCEQPDYYDWGWWWGGTTKLYGWWSYDGHRGSQPAASGNPNSCFVPWYQDYNDWTVCGVPS